ncbi:MAG: hypothetical protein JRL30_28500 [Deltaproteobacteria bacterium]|nr:hypothetical protein [Deltaproteobacteria bacterium]
MTSVNLEFRFKGKVGDGNQIRYREFPGMVLDATITKKEEHTPSTVEWGKCCYYRAEALGNTVKVETHFCGYVGKPYDTSIHLAVYYAYDEVRVPSHLRAEVLEPEEIETKEIVFSMKGEDEKLLTQEMADVGGKLLDCEVIKIEGHPGADFHVRRISERGVRCEGGFVREAGETGVPEAQVTVTLAIKTE